MPIAPLLDTPRLILRQPELSDAEAHFEYSNDWSIVRNFPSTFPWPYPANGAIDFLTMTLDPKQPHYFWALILKENANNDMIGLIELRPDFERGQRGFWIAPDYQNLGLMTEAVFTANDFWFETLDRDVLRMANAATNEGSRRVKEKTGATLIEVVPNTPHLDPTLDKTEHWELTRDAWRAFKENV